MATALFPGSFDPFTNGHTDIVHRSLAVFDRIVIGVLANYAKSALFSADERVELIKEVLRDVAPRIEVAAFSGLLVDFAKSRNVKVIVRGLRAISDYDYEAQMALVNKNLNPDIETFFLVAREENAYTSSTIVRQVAMHGGAVTKFVHPSVEKALRAKKISSDI